MRSCRRFHARFLRLLSERLPDSPVSLAEGRALVETRHHPGGRTRGAMALLGLDRGYPSRMEKRFERTGPVPRDGSPPDRCMRDLSLTPEGERLFAEVNQRVTARTEDILAPLTEEERDRSVRAMSEREDILIHRRGDEERSR